MGKFDIVMKRSASSMYAPFMAEDDWGILIASIMLCDKLSLVPELKRWHLEVNPNIEKGMFTCLNYFFNIEEVEKIYKDDNLRGKGLEESLQAVTSSLCPYASIGGIDFADGACDNMKFQGYMIGIIKKYTNSVVEKMGALGLFVEDVKSARMSAFTTAIQYIRNLHQAGKQDKLQAIANNVHEKMLQMATFMKLMQRNNKDNKFEALIGYIATSVAMMNYLTFGNNEGEPLFTNCLAGNKGVLSSMPSNIMLNVLPRISKYVYNAKKISPLMLELICHKDSRDVMLTDKLCKKYAKLFMGEVFSSNWIDVGLIKTFDNENNEELLMDL